MYEDEVKTDIFLNLLQFDQGGLTLPARNYYLNESEKEVVDAYIEYITKVIKKE